MCLSPPFSIYVCAEATSTPALPAFASSGVAVSVSVGKNGIVVEVGCSIGVLVGSGSGVLLGCGIGVFDGCGSGVLLGCGIGVFVGCGIGVSVGAGVELGIKTGGGVDVGGRMGVIFVPGVKNWPGVGCSGPSEVGVTNGGRVTVAARVLVGSRVAGGRVGVLVARTPEVWGAAAHRINPMQ